jgi:hypothetical protein
MAYSFIDNDELNKDDNVPTEEGMEGSRYLTYKLGDMGGMDRRGDMYRQGYSENHKPYEVPQKHLRESHALHPTLDFIMFLVLAFVISFVVLPGAAFYFGQSPIYYLATALVCTVVSYGIYFNYFYPTN